MQRGVRLRNYKTTRLQISERGYMMITLMLAVAMITLAMLAVLPEIKQQIKRDREEEMIHRGTAYMRAIQHFYKKLGRYPTRVEELENTNNLRFLRKRYTDPLSWDPVVRKEKEFKFLHQMDITLNNGPVLGQTPGQSGLSGQGGFGGAQSGFGGTQGGFGNTGAQMGAPQQTGATGAQTPSPGDSGNSSSGNPSDTAGNSNSSASSSSNPNTGSDSGSGLSGQVFGGGPILGVASTSKAKSIREFYGKSKYKDWFFIYVPQADVGGLLKGPVNPGASTPNLGGGSLNPGLSGGMSGQGLGSTASQPQGLSNQAPQNPAPTTPQQ